MGFSPIVVYTLTINLLFIVLGSSLDRTSLPHGAHTGLTADLLHTVKILPMFTSFCFFQASKVLVADLGQATESADVETYMYLNNGLSTMK